MLPDGDGLVAGAAPDVGLHVRDRAGRGPVGEGAVEALREHPERGEPGGAGADRLVQSVAHREQREALDERDDAGAGEVGGGLAEQRLGRDGGLQVVAHRRRSYFLSR